MAGLKRTFSALSASLPAMDDEDAFFVFDLDQMLLDTRILYPVMTQNTIDFLVQKHDVPEEKAVEIIEFSLRNEGGYFNDTIHDSCGVPKAETLRHTFDPATMDFTKVQIPTGIHQFLSRIKGQKLIYTNASTAFATAALKAADLYEHFNENDIIGNDRLNCVRKPYSQSYDAFMTLTGCVPGKTVFFDDKIYNLQTAKSKGWHTVLVREFACEDTLDALDLGIPDYIDCVPMSFLSFDQGEAAASLLPRSLIASLERATGVEPATFSLGS